ncbi:ArsR/SmtB family transcription factor [Actinomadura namibiensis]|uniref:ArsR/SmtB family transcription factor n=1 Tax=Actinomadura kijaniata TaxID=46161 RepID=UPI0024838654
MAADRRRGAPRTAGGPHPADRADHLRAGRAGTAGAPAVTARGPPRAPAFGGGPTRLRILGLPAARPRPTRGIAGLVGLTEAAVSRHLKVLAEAGWVSAERHGYHVYYRLVRDARGRITDALGGLLV